MKRVAVLFQDTGGGHRSLAESIARAIDSESAESVGVSCVNATRYLPFPWDQGERTYPAAADRARFLHAAFYQSLDGKRRVSALRRLLVLTGARRADRLLRDHPADVYVSCNPLFGQVVPAAIRRAGGRIAFVQVVADLARSHAASYGPGFDACLVPSEETKRQAIDSGVPARVVRVTGEPVLPDLQDRIAAGKAMRPQLGLRPGDPVALLVGGADGVRPLPAVAQALMASDLQLQLVVVCGRNERLRVHLESLPTTLTVKALGFVTNLPELLGAADVLVTKAGTMTICEGFVAGLPILLYDAIPGQETGNVRFVVDAGAGAWCATPTAVVARLRAWLADSTKLEALGRASAGLARPQAAVDVARVVLGLAGVGSAM